MKTPAKDDAGIASIRIAMNRYRIIRGIFIESPLFGPPSETCCATQVVSQRSQSLSFRRYYCINASGGNMLLGARSVLILYRLREILLRQSSRGLLSFVGKKVGGERHVWN